MNNAYEYSGVNPELIKMALAKTAEAHKKEAFIPVGDPNMDPMAAAGGMPPGGAPPGMPPGGAPPGMPMDPAMAGGMPPGGAPPMDPAMAGGMPPPPPGGLGPDEIRMIIKEELAQSGMGGGAGGAGGLKPKIDVNVEMMQIKKILARISDTLGIQIPASDMVVTSDDLNAMAQGGAGAGAGAGAGGQSAIQPIQPLDPMQAAAPGGPPGAPGGGAGGAGGGDEKQSEENLYISMGSPHGDLGSGIEGYANLANRASAIMRLQGMANAS